MYTNILGLPLVDLSYRIQTVGNVSSVTPNANNTDILIIGTLNQNIAVNSPSGSPIEGQMLEIRFKHSVSLTVSWGSAFRSISTASIPNQSSDPGTTYFFFQWNDVDNTWDLINFLMN